MTTYGVTLPKYSSRFRAVSKVEEAQDFESGRTEWCKLALWIRCIPKALKLEKKMT